MGLLKYLFWIPLVCAQIHFKLSQKLNRKKRHIAQSAWKHNEHLRPFSVPEAL